MKEKPSNEKPPLTLDVIQAISDLHDRNIGNWKDFQTRRVTATPGLPSGVEITLKRLDGTMEGVFVPDLPPTTTPKIQ